jgi:hypothetical protein
VQYSNLTLCHIPNNVLYFLNNFEYNTVRFYILDFYVYIYIYIIRLNYNALRLYRLIKSSNTLYLDNLEKPFVLISAC